MTPATLTDLLQACRTSDRRLTLVEGQDRERVLAYRDLPARAAARWATLHASGAVAGEALIILTEDRIAFVELFWAATLGGLIPVPVAGGISDEHRLKLFRIATRLQRPWLVTEAASAERLTRFAEANPDAVPAGTVEALRERTRLLDEYSDQDAGARESESGPVPVPVPVPEHVPDPDDVALVQFSSGSTSAPKGVVLTHRNLLTNLDGIVSGMALRAGDAMLSWMPLTHDMGLIGFHLTPLIGDIEQVLMPTDVFVRRPMLWLDAASRHGTTILCSPNFGYEHLLKSFKPERLAGIDLSAVRLVFNGAEPISAPLIERFNAAMAPANLSPVAMFPVYGLAEASLAVSFPEMGAPVQVRHLSRDALGIGARVAADADGAAFVAVGRPIEHVRVRLADERGQTLSEARVGRVLISGGNVTSGYLGEDGLEGVRDTSLIDEQGWLDTGDLAVQLAGQLYITGRAKDLLFVNGQNLYPHDLEQTLQASGLVEAGRIAIAAVPTDDPGRDRAVAFVQHRGDLDAFASLRDTLRGELSQRASVVLDEIVPVPRLPKTTSGKVQRFVLVQSLLAGEFDTARRTLGPMGPASNGSADASRDASTVDDPDDASRSDAAVSGDDESVEGRLLTMCRARIEGAPPTAADNLFELGISSLTLAEIHADIEASWPGVLDITDLFDYPSVAEIAAVLRERTEAG